MSKSFLAQLRTEAFYPGSDAVRRFTFNLTDRGDRYALLASANHQLAAGFANSGEKSALFARKDCFECLSPHKIAA